MPSGKKGSGRGLTKKEKEKIRNFVLVIILMMISFFAGMGVAVLRMSESAQETVETEKLGKPDIDVELLDINDYSRPGIELDEVNAIVIHYTANPGSSAMNNRDYFNNLQKTHATKASSHFIVGLEGEIVQCIPTSEIAYASNDRNHDTISIECCIEDDSGAFNEATYDSVIYLTAWLCDKFSLDSDDVIRHYDVSGKNCPKYYVEHEDKWEQFRADVADYLRKD